MLKTLLAKRAGKFTPYKRKKQKTKGAFTMAQYQRKINKKASKDLIVSNPNSFSVFPNKFETTMRFFAAINYDSSTQFAELHEFDFNDLFDPMNAEGAIKYNNYDYIKNNYKNYCVTGAWVRFIYDNRNTGAMILTYLPYTTGETAPTIGNYTIWGSMDGAKNYYIPGTNSATNNRINGGRIYVDCVRLTGQNDVFDNGNEFAAIATNQPTKAVATYFGVQQADFSAGSTTFTGTLWLEVKAKVVFWGVQKVQDNT